VSLGATPLIFCLLLISSQHNCLLPLVLCVCSFFWFLKMTKLPPSETTMKCLLDNRTVGLYLPKKKIKQLKLKDAFRRSTLNWQRHPKEKCVFQSDIGKFVFQPPKCGKLNLPSDLSVLRCCDSCFLTPCLTHKWHPVDDRLVELHTHPEFAMEEAEKAASNFLLETCGIIWMKRMKFFPFVPGKSLPSCALQEIPNLMERILRDLEYSKSDPPEWVDWSHKFQDKKYLNWP